MAGRDDVGMVVSGRKRWRCDSCYFRAWCPRLAQCRSEQADRGEQGQGSATGQFGGAYRDHHDGIENFPVQREGLMRRITLWMLEWAQRCPSPIGDEKYQLAMKESG